MPNNLWQLIMEMMKRKQAEEEQRRMLEAGKLGGHGAHDGGMSLEQMFRQFRPSLMDAWEGGGTYNKKPMPPPDMMTFGNPALHPSEGLRRQQFFKEES